MSQEQRKHPDCTDASGHYFNDVYSGRRRCVYCGYDYERHGVFGHGFPPDGPWPCYYIDNVYSMPGESPFAWKPGVGWISKWAAE